MRTVSFKKAVKITGAVGIACIVFAFILGFAGPPIDRYFGWAPEDVVWGDVVVMGRYGLRWHRLAQTLMVVGSISIGISLMITFMCKFKRTGYPR